MVTTPDNISIVAIRVVWSHKYGEYHRVSDEERELIHKLYVKSSCEFGVPSLARMFNRAPKTQRPPPPQYMPRLLIAVLPSTP